MTFLNLIDNFLRKQDLLSTIDSYLAKQQTKLPPGWHKHPGIVDSHPIETYHKDPKVRHRNVTTTRKRDLDQTKLRVRLF